MSGVYFVVLLSILDILVILINIKCINILHVFIYHTVTVIDISLAGTFIQGDLDNHTLFI